MRFFAENTLIYKGFCESVGATALTRSLPLAGIPDDRKGYQHLPTFMAESSRGQLTDLTSLRLNEKPRGLRPRGSTRCFRRHIGKGYMDTQKLIGFTSFFKPQKSSLGSAAFPQSNAPNVSWSDQMEISDNAKQIAGSVVPLTTCGLGNREYPKGQRG